MTADETPKPEWKTRRMKGGDWIDSSTKTPVRRADKIVSVRLTEAELAEFDAQIEVLGLKRSRALRIAARRIGGFVEADAAQVETLREIARQLIGVARNINQIAKAADRTGEPDFRAFMEERAVLGRQMAAVQGQTQAILNLAARREDGLARLEKAAGE